jgi:hypothetical protein
MKKQESISIEAAAENWQRCRQEDLPRIFYAYDDKEHQSERLVSFRLKGKKTIQGLTDLIEDPSDFKFIVHLGLRKFDLSEPIPSKPAFLLYLQVYNKKGDWQKNYVQLKWDKNSRFSKAMEDGTDSGTNAIPAASAYLFVQSWLEMPEVMLAKPFTAATRVMGQRVKAYIFSPEESYSIYLDIMNSTEDCLDIHLGNGLAVWDHPFSFRPVIEVKGAVPKGKNRQVPMNATGPLDDDGNSYYDFGSPHPPGTP